MTDNPKTGAGKRGFWRRLRIYFRRFRILLWLVILLLLGVVIYLNQEGLPEFVKTRLLQRLEAQGIDLQFSRIRLRWYEGLVAENIRFGQTTSEATPSFTAKEAKLLLGWRELLKGRTQVEALMVRGGTIRIPVQDQNLPGRELVVTNIQTQLRLLPGDQWMLDRFRATFADARLHLSAQIQNASVAREWPFLQPSTDKNGSQERTRRRVKMVADILDKIQFSETPEMVVEITGDAKDPRSFMARIDTEVTTVQTPWGNVTNGQFHVRVHPSRAGSDFTGTIDLDAVTGSSPWASAERFKLHIELAQAETITNSVQATLNLSAAMAATRWASGSNVSANLRWVHSLDKAVPLWATGTVACADVQTKWASARRAKLHASLTSTNGTSASISPDWGWWTNLAPYAVEWECEAEGAETPQVRVQHANLAGAWATPRFQIKSAHADLYDGRLDASGALTVDTRRAEASASLDFDLKQATNVFTEGARKWISRLSWDSPPRVDASASAILPAWTNHQPDWRGEVLPTLWLSGHLTATNGAGYQGIIANSVTGSFIYSNMTWNLPDLEVRRPEGRLLASHRADDRTRDYYWKISSTLHPEAIRPLLKTNEADIFDLVQLSSPPSIEAELWGKFHQYDLLGGRAFVRATNFSFRGQSATRMEAEVIYTNKVVRVLSPVVEREGEQARADSVVVDFNAQQVYITNATGVFAPMAIARAIGPKVGKTMEDYQFERPPRAKAYGVVPMHGELGADLHFEVDGGPFHWWKFHLPRISGHVHWKDYQLSLANIDADFYNGKAYGSAVFDVSDLPGTEFIFSMSGTNVLLQALLADLTTSPSKSEGWVTGTIVVTRANANDWRTVQGHGQLSFRDGLLWEIPLFGILSPMLDTVMPGLGSSRATEGSCTYILTNGVFRTSNFDVRTLPMRLQYRGDVDLADNYKVQARVEAELLKDMWVVGPLVSAVLTPVTKLFEFKVGGDLSKPTLEPVNVIPKLMLLPFYPFRAFRGLGSDPQKQDPPTPTQPPVK